MGSCPCLRPWLRFGRDMTVAVWRGLQHLLGPFGDNDNWQDWIPADDPFLS